MIKKYLNDVRLFCSGFPILGGLLLCTPKQHLSALTEFTVGLLFSSATFWLSTLILSLLNANQEKNMLELFYSTMSSGELFIFTVGFIGPIMLTVLDDSSSKRPFPGKTWHLFLIVILALAAASCFALIKAAGNDASLPSVNESALFSTSVTIAGLAIALRYLAIVYKKYSVNSEKDLKNMEVKFSERYEAHLDQEVR